MSRFLVVFIVLLLGQGSAVAQTGDPQAGKTLWEGANTGCRNCHGGKGEGAFGPDLAGRRLTVAQFTRAVREPWGIMPAYVESQLSARDLSNLVAYFDSLPSLERPGPWRYQVPADAPSGQAVALAAVGCGQCHGPTLDVPRTGMGAVGADFEWFKSLVYDHTTTMPQFRLAVGDSSTRMRMGNYPRSRLPESLLQEIFTFTRDLGFRAPVSGELSAGVAGPTGVTYTLNVENVGVREKGLTAEDLTINLVVPTGANVVSTTGAGYEGVRFDERAKANVAVWRAPRIAPKDRQTYTITLSRAGTATDNVRGSIRWTKPAVKTGPFDIENIAPAPVARSTQ